MGHCTGSSHRIGDERAPTASTANRGSADAKRSKTTGPRGRREGSHEALVRFSLSLPTTKPLWDLPSKCMQTTAHSCPCPGPGHRHLSPRLWQQLPHGPPCLYSQTSIPTLSDLILGPNHWHKSANASPVYLSSPGLTPECQTPLFHFLLSGSTGCVTHPQPLLVFPIQFPELLPASAQAKKP